MPTELNQELTQEQLTSEAPAEGEVSAAAEPTTIQDQDEPEQPAEA